MPDREAAKACARGHDIAQALANDQQFCPICSKSGIKTLIVQGKMLCPKCIQIIDKGSRKCPECGVIIEDKKGQERTTPLPERAEEFCPGCVTLGRENPEIMVLKSAKNSQGKSFCPSCGSSWANLCPYCGAGLEKLTVCTKGSDRCIFESPPIVLCEHCNCAVTPDTAKCPRCFQELHECQQCKAEGKAKRMIAKDAECSEKHAKAEVAASVASP